jgi:hypothetical protein
VADVVVVVLGKWLRTAVVKDEWWLKSEAVKDPERFLMDLGKSGLKADIFAFGRRPPLTEPALNYPVEWDNVAAIPITTFAEWWEKQITADVRQNIKKARKNDVVVRPVPFDDELVRGIMGIYNESPIRQGKPFYHYGEDFETVKRLNSTYSDHTSFIGAFFEKELIGFVELNWMEPIADIKQILCKNTHYDKKPGNLLIAKAVEICAEKGLSHLLYGKYHYYGNLEGNTLSDFKRRNGFRRMPVPKYYVPLTLKGRMAMWVNLHLGVKRLVPEKTLRNLLTVRARLFETRVFQTCFLPKCVRPGNQAGPDSLK